MIRPITAQTYAPVNFKANRFTTWDELYTKYGNFTSNVPEKTIVENQEILHEQLQNTQRQNAAILRTISKLAECFDSNSFERKEIAYFIKIMSKTHQDIV